MTDQNIEDFEDEEIEKPEGEGTEDKDYDVEFDCLYCDKEFDPTVFDAGFANGSYYAGFYGALINIGIRPEDALTILLHHMDDEHDKTVAEMTANMNIEIAKADFLKDKKITF